MQRLLQFLFKYRVFILFVLLEGICFWIIVSNNNYQGAKYLNASNSMSASLVSTSQDVSDYFDLKSQNDLLAEENARLRQQILEFADSATLVAMEADTVTEGIKAKVIDNSVFFRNNYLIINQGQSDGVEEGMGVLGPDGIVGQIQNVSNHYSTIISLLHSKTIVSSRHNESGSLCSVVWDGTDPLQANVEFLPRHIKIAVGDTVTTSGYNSVYPEGSMIGVVEDVSIGPGETFYDIKIMLTTSFSSLSYVYLLKHHGKEEIDSLRTINTDLDG